MSLMCTNSPFIDIILRNFNYSRTSSDMGGTEGTLDYPCSGLFKFSASNLVFPDYWKHSAVNLCAYTATISHVFGSAMKIVGAALYFRVVTFARISNAISSDYCPSQCGTSPYLPLPRESHRHREPGRGGCRVEHHYPSVRCPFIQGCFWG